MRVLSTSLLLCFILICARNGAAQNANQASCNSDDPGLLDFEIGIRVDTGTSYTVDVYDMDSGVRVSRRAVSRSAEVYGV